MEKVITEGNLLIGYIKFGRILPRESDCLLIVETQLYQSTELKKCIGSQSDQILR